jgi:hypothetical protein
MTALGKIRKAIKGAAHERIEPGVNYKSEHAAHMQVEMVIQNSVISHARGRIMEQHEAGGVYYNRAQIVDGARPMYYDEDTDSVHIRIDNEDTPSFWVEFDLNMAALHAFIESEKAFGRDLDVSDGSKADAAASLIADVDDTKNVDDTAIDHHVATNRRNSLKRKRSNSLH